MSIKPKIAWDGGTVPMEEWAKDHWSTFAYAETRAVDHGGVLDPRHLRQDGDAYPTRCKTHELVGHTDINCLEDADEAGLLHITAGALVVVFTDAGKAMAGALRGHKLGGGNFAQFVPPKLVS